MADQTAPAPAAKPSRRQRQQQKLYEGAGAQQLAEQPAEIEAAAAPRVNDWAILKLHQEARLTMLTAWRFSWMANYQLLESYILPRRGIFINPTQPTPNSMIRGIPINQNIVDGTGTYAMRRAAAGMMSGLASPSRPWFKLKPKRGRRDEVPDEVLVWFEGVEDAMYSVLSGSNIYDSFSQMFEDLVTFGTAPMIIYEDDTDVIRCYTPCCGEYFLASSSANRVESMYRLYVMTAMQIVEEFGLENCPIDIQQMWKEKGGQLDVERLVAHAIEPNMGIAHQGRVVGKVPGDFTWRETYWIRGGSSDWPLRMRGFKDQPHIAPRWAVTSNDPYGRSVGMDVFPDILQLQIETKRKAEAIEKQVRPPLLADMSMKNEPSSILPGHITYVPSLGPDKGMRPIYTVMPDIAAMERDLLAIQTRIKEGFYGDLFMSLESKTERMTAYEVAQRQQEKLQVLGPVVERLQNEALGPAIKRVFAIMLRKNLLPPIPESMRGMELGIEYVGMMALAQKAASTASLERFMQAMTQLQLSDPSVKNMWDRQEAVNETAEALFISKKILNPPEKVAALNKADAQAAAQQQQMAMLQQGAAAAKDAGSALGSVGGNLDAINTMTGLGGPVAGSA